MSRSTGKSDLYLAAEVTGKALAVLSVLLTLAVIVILLIDAFGS